MRQPAAEERRHCRNRCVGIAVAQFNAGAMAIDASIDKLIHAIDAYYVAAAAADVEEAEACIGPSKHQSISPSP